ncbi:MAG: glycosyltransferase involved in cell wall biosynthesis [Halioglobus sp.]|jgi:glycosyltransferase involved in cell wall biosynthesis
MKVLLLSAYAAHSHRHWAESLLQMFPEWQWQVLELPPRHFSWRVRGNPLYWALSEREVLEQTYDCLLATSMVDLATLRGLVPSLAQVPTAVYFHENQFAYPLQNLPQQPQNRPSNLLEAQMVSLYAALAADKVLFNSQYNMESFMSGCHELLSRLPDKVPPGVLPILQTKADILPVAIDILSRPAAQPDWPGIDRYFPATPLRIVWLGRFEYDKGPNGLLRILSKLEGESIDYEIAVIGQQFRKSPAKFDDIEKTFSHRLVHFGYIESGAEYQAMLRGADIVLSTALHEFQGLSVLEAVCGGCIPVVPQRLVYPEIFNQQYCYKSCDQEPEQEAAAAVGRILHFAQQLRAGEAEVPDVSAFRRERLEPRYQAMFKALLHLQDSQ